MEKAFFALTVVPPPHPRSWNVALKFEIKYRPSYSLLEVQLLVNGHIIAEAGALTYMSSNIDVETRTRVREQGILGTIKTSLLGGETLFINDYQAKGGPGKTGSFQRR